MRERSAKIAGILLIATIILIAIGYAAITNVELKISGTGNAQANKDNFIVELENGNYMPAERLSTGTIDQLYLSLRLAMLDEISNEKVPIILDESFAYYDDERLKNILNYLVNEFNDRQIIIFTCSHREKDILTKENINYNFVTI